MKFLTLITLIMASLGASAKTLEIEATANATYNARCAVAYMPVFDEAGNLVKDMVSLADVVVNIPNNKSQDILTYNGVIYHVDYSAEMRVSPPARYVTLMTLDAKTKKVLNWAGNSFRTKVAPAMYLALGEGPQFYCMDIEIRNNPPK